MNKIKKSMIILSIIMTILIVVIIVLICVLKANQKELNNETQISEIERPDYKDNEIEQFEYSTINGAVTAYIQTANKNNSLYMELKQLQGEEETNKQMNQKIINMLSKTYIQNNNITIDNLQDYITLENEQLMFVPLKIKILTDENIKTYVVEGFTENIKYESKGKKCFIVNVDYSNQTYSIEPTNKQYDEIKQADKITSISKNEDNVYINKTSSSETKVKDYILLYKKLVLAEPEIAYNYMEEEYRNKRFGSIEKFKEYIENNRETIERISVEQYLTENHDDYTEYVAKDQYSNLYIFDEKNVLDFTFKLDTYTIPTEKFQKTYNSADDQNKVAMNIDKWIQMLNTRDYENAYNVLNETFRNNNWKTEKEFEKYIKDKLPLHYKVEYTTYSNEKSTYAQTINLTDVTDENSEKITLNIIMQLKDNYDFVMSFSIEE